jgi:hypothetical protein
MTAARTGEGAHFSFQATGGFSFRSLFSEEVVMLRYSLVRILLLAACLAALSVGDRAAAGVPPTGDRVPDLTEFPDYFGPFTSDMFGGGFVEFEVIRQEGRHFWGIITFEIGGMAMPGFMFHGTEQPPPTGDRVPNLTTNKFKGKGSGPAGDVAFDGTLVDSGGGVIEIMADYVFMGADGSMDMGSAFFTNAPNR